jgi:hypothetical protein
VDGRPRYHPVGGFPEMEFRLMESIPSRMSAFSASGCSSRSGWSIQLMVKGASACYHLRSGIADAPVAVHGELMTMLLKLWPCERVDIQGAPNCINGYL